MTLKDKIDGQRHFLLYCELLGLLHDIGKLSNGFYDYRKRWKGDHNGWNKDPHDHEFFQHPRDKKSYGDYKGDNGDLDAYPDLKKCFGMPPAFVHLPPVVPVATVICAAHAHVDPKCDLIEILKLADRVDAAIDRNNPLFSADQTANGNIIYDTDIFGAEDGTKVDITGFEDKRLFLYKKLDEKLNPSDPISKSLLEDYLEKFLYDAREKVLKAIKDCTHIGTFSDTTRPNNDTSLWEHSYAVASIFKVILVHNIIYEDKIVEPMDVRFSIFGIGWDGLAYMSSGHKIGDVVGRQRTIKDLKEKIKSLVEYEYLLGNTIYEDDNGIYFIVPAIEGFSFDKPSGQRREYEDILFELHKEILKCASTATDGDIYPHIHITPPTPFMTRLVECMQEVQKKVKTPIGSSIPANWVDWQFKADDTVCQLCKKRPAGKTEICDKCYERRAKPVREIVEVEGKDSSRETPFISEIVKASKTSNKACLIVAKFGINEWLNGKMIRSLFIKQANTLDTEVGDLTNIKQVKVKEGETDIKAWHDENTPHKPDGYKYDLIKKEIDLCRNYESLSDKDKKYAENIVFLYNRRIVSSGVANKDASRFLSTWDPFLESAILEYGNMPITTDELLYNIVCAKTPTPSTVLDVWGATKEFLEEIDIAALEKESEEGKREKIIKEQNRIVCRINKPTHFNDEKINLYQAYEGQIDGEAVEAVWLNADTDEAWIIGRYDFEKKKGDWNEKMVRLKGKPLGATKEVEAGLIKEIKSVKYSPFRTITATPDLFMAIVPADKAVEITKAINAKYVKRFGKVMGRLPMSIGHVFFTEKMPMFVVLDSARRMVNGFRRNEAVDVKVVKVLECGKENGYRKFVVKEETAGNAMPVFWELPFRLGTGKEDWHHPYFIIKSGDKLAERKTYFKTVVGPVVHFSAIKEDDVIEAYPNRYEYVFIDSTTRRYEIGKSPPRRLEDLEQGMERLWLMLRVTPGMTDTRLRNVEGLLRTKFEEWNIRFDQTKSSEFEEWKRLTVTTIELEFKGFADRLFLKEAILSGLFFDCLELYLRVLKLRIAN